MRYPQGDLPILSVETYNDSIPSTSRRAATARTSPSTVSSRSSDGGPRKRARTQAVDAGEAEDEKRRARGRPRLDTKDETAADRRRTQIRLAQRAYRNRKENAIQTLEKKVQHLKDTNEEMSNAFMQLHDFALSKGLLDKMPDFGRQLRETTERFLSLARDASDDEAKDGESKAGSGSPTEHRPSNDRPHRDSPGRTNSAEPAEAVPPPEPDTGTEENPKTLYGGLMLSYEPPPTQVAFTPSIPTTSTRTTLPTTFAHSPTPNPYDNPFPIPTLPPPTTYANHETTFGRRLQRYAIEQALLLITMPSPPQQFLARVFGFCLLLESPQTIHRRLRRMLGREAGETLDNWRYPFFHLGGAGTHFEVLGGEGGEVGLRMGNRGTVEVDKPGVTAGFATGPFEVGVGAVRDGGLVDRDMRMVLPGFAGEYFDCDEAEVYLYRRGVVMTPGEDVVTVEVDVGDVEFGRLAGDEDGYGGWGAGRVWKARTVDRYSGSSSSGSGLSPVSSSSGGAMVDMPLLSTQLQDVSGGGWSMDGDAIVDPVLADVFAQQASFVSPTTTGEASTALYSSGSEGGAMLPFGVLVSDGSGNSGYGLTMTQSPNRRRVDVDVMKMMKELCQRAICLGRSPGFKQADIDAAFWAAVQADLE